MVKGLYVHGKEGRLSPAYRIACIKYEGEGPVTIVQNNEYILIQVIQEKTDKSSRLYLFKNIELCMQGFHHKKLSKEELKEELQWCIEKYEEDLRKQ